MRTGEWVRSPAEASGRLVGPPVFKTGGGAFCAPQGSIPCASATFNPGRLPRRLRRLGTDAGRPSSATWGPNPTAAVTRVKPKPSRLRDVLAGVDFLAGSAASEQTYQREPSFRRGTIEMRVETE
jgi:hypothetical protein